MRWHLQLTFTHSSNEDDLTVKLAEIVSANNLVKMSLHAGQASQTLMVRRPFEVVPTRPRRS